MTPEQVQKIVDGAPEGVRYYCTSAEVYHRCDDLLRFECCVRLRDLRTQLAKHDTLDLEPADIPHGTIVLEK